MSPQKTVCGAVNHVIACRHGLMAYNQYDSWIGRSLERYGEYCPGEARLFQAILRCGMTVVEVGANIGVHTVLLAKLVGERGRVLAFEPQPVVFQLLCANLALNSILHARCRQVAVAAEPGTLRLPAVDYCRPGNFGSVRPQERGGESVEVIRLDSLQLERCHFIKIDVEGMEREVLQGGLLTLQKLRPMLYLENDSADHASQIVHWLRDLGYCTYRFAPAYFEPDNYFQNSENVLGDFRNVCLVAIHSSWKPQIEGLEQWRVSGDQRERETREWQAR
jgi:FkbM family methyltransferase